MIRPLLILLLSLTAFGQPAPINRRAFALSSLATGTQSNGVSAFLMAWYGNTNVYNKAGNPASTNDEVNWWSNQIVNTYHLTNSGSTPTIYPTNRYTGADGSNYIRWDLNGSGFAPTVFTNNINCGSNYTVYAIVRVFPSQGGFNTSTRQLLGLDARGTEGALLWWKPSTIALATGATFGPSTIASNTWMSVAIIGQVTNCVLYTNTALYVQSSTVLPPMTNMSVGGVISGISGTGDFEELLVYTNNITLTQLTNIQTYFHGKYPTSIPLP